MITLGQTLNNTYEVIEQLGSGSGGIIFKAYHKRMKKFVAIKLIKEEIKGGISNRSEVDVLKDLKHYHIPQVIDFIEDGDDVYTVMEFIEGRNFKQLIQSGMEFDEKRVRKYAVQLCEAVEYLHGHKPPIIHSDIKPANIMLTPDDNIVLIDFNISMMSRNGIAVSKGGSRDFAAPEQFRRMINAPTEIDEFHEETRFIDSDETEIISDIQTESRQYSTSSTKNVERAYIDIRTDIYGIGASLYYILTGRVPQGGRLDFRGVRCSSIIRGVILKAMDPDPQRRYKSAEEMCTALNARPVGKPIIISMASVCAVGLFAAAAAVIPKLGVSPDTVSASTGNVTAVSETTASVVYSEKSSVKSDITINETTVETHAESQAEEKDFITIKGTAYDVNAVSLDLSERELTNSDISELYRMTELTELDLSRNNISDITVLGKLTNLEKLYLDSNNVTDISALKDCPNLKMLWWDKNGVTDLHGLSAVPNLTELTLNHNRLSDLNPLTSMKKLDRLFLMDTGISNTRILMTLDWIGEMNLSDNPILYEDIISLKVAIPHCNIMVSNDMLVTETTLETTLETTSVPQSSATPKTTPASIPDTTAKTTQAPPPVTTPPETATILSSITTPRNTTLPETTPSLPHEPEFEPDIYLLAGEKIDLTSWTELPQQGTTWDDYIWESSDESVIDINMSLAVMKTKKVGNAVITLTLRSDKSKSYKLKIRSADEKELKEYLSGLMNS